jgi:tetratricopeptide (TPR) repeat protein
MKHLLKLAFSLLLLSSCESHIPPKTLWQDFKARQELKAEKYEEALLRYFQMLESDGSRLATHSNIGVLLSKMQKPEDALKSLQHALKLALEQKDPVGIFAVNFNLGVYYGAQKKVTEALESYQAALEVNPASIEAKTNIELLIRQQQQEQQEKDQQKKEGEGEGEDPNQKPKDGDKGDDQKKDDKGDKPKDEPKDGDDEKKQDQPRQQSPKYKPRPFKGDQLSEGDVKKILGELKNQEQKIRANFDKNEKGKSRDNEKDW